MTALTHSDFQIRQSIQPPLWRRAWSALRKPVVDDSYPRRYNPAHFEIVGDFFERFSINASPGNYALVYRFCVGQDSSLLPQISDLIKTGYAPDDSRLAVTESALESDLLSLADSTQEQLNSIEAVVSQSHSHTSDFGAALKGAAATINDDSVDKAALTELFELTREMIVKTRRVESELRQRTEAIEGLQRSLTDAKHKADTDALTGLANRRAFERQLGAAAERSRSSKVPCSLAICDIDLFKKINDSYGHQTGDRVIKLVADIVADHCGDKGKGFRFGGEEFVILFENTELNNAIETMEAVRADLEGRHVVHKESGKALGTISLSAGVAELDNEGDPGVMLGKADRALYIAKSEGRNCVRHAEK